MVGLMEIAAARLIAWHDGSEILSLSTNQLQKLKTEGVCKIIPSEPSVLFEISDLISFLITIFIYFLITIFIDFPTVFSVTLHKLTRLRCDSLPAKQCCAILLQPQK